MPLQLDMTVPVTDGKISKTASLRVAQHIRLFGDRDVRIRISSPKRTSKANRYYWKAVIEPIRIAMMDAGLGFASAEAVHTYFKRKYLPMRTDTVMGEDITRDPSTRYMDSTAFHDYIERIKTDETVLALGVVFDEPGEFRSYRIAEVE